MVSDVTQDLRHLVIDLKFGPANQDAHIRRLIFVGVVGGGERVEGLIHLGSIMLSQSQFGQGEGLVRCGGSLIEDGARGVRVRQEFLLSCVKALTCKGAGGLPTIPSTFEDINRLVLVAPEIPSVFPPPFQ